MFMKAVVTSYRRSRHVQKPDEVLLKVEGIENSSAAHTLLGKKVEIHLPKSSKMSGKVVAVHGGKGIVRARFSKGVPGQALGSEATVA